MISDSKVLQSNIPLVRKTIDFFTASARDEVLSKEITEIATKWSTDCKVPNAESFIKLGYLSVSEFLMYLSTKKMMGSGVNTRIVELTLKALVEKHIVSVLGSGLASGNDPRYKPTGEFAKMVYENDLILNLIFGYEYIIDKYQQSIFKIEHIDKHNDPSIGTGFLVKIGAQRYVLTNKHVIENAVRIKVYDKQDILIESGNSITDGTTDLAVIPLVQKNVAPFFMLNPHLEILKDIITIGYPSIPMTKLAYQVYHKGEVNSFVEDYNGNNLFLISAKTSSGNSGSPVIDSTGLVLGIVTEELFEKEQFYEKGKLPYYAAIPSSEILNFIKQIEKST